MYLTCKNGPSRRFSFISFINYVTIIIYLSIMKGKNPRDQEDLELVH